MDLVVRASVLMITYNHRDFIAQAIESVLSQQTSFDYELVIGDDCSTDGTREIVQDFQAMRPGRVRLLPAEPNLGVVGNFVRTYHGCRGQYVALLEGDDRWTSPDKLQAQVEYLDAHLECAACFHATKVFHEADDVPARDCFPIMRRRTYGIEDLLESNFMYTCSVTFRNHLFGDFPKWFHTMRVADWPLHVLNAEHGKIGYLDRVMSAYRIHPGGVWSRLRQIERLREELETYKIINQHLEYRYDREIRAQVGKRYYRLAVAHWSEGNPSEAKRCALKSIAACPLNRHLAAGEMAGLLINLYAPPVHRLANVVRAAWRPSVLR